MVKSQVVNIIGLILSLIRRKNIVETSGPFDRQDESGLRIPRTPPKPFPVDEGVFKSPAMSSCPWGAKTEPSALPTWGGGGRGEMCHHRGVPRGRGGCTRPPRGPRPPSAGKGGGGGGGERALRGGLEGRRGCMAVSGGCAQARGDRPETPPGAENAYRHGVEARRDAHTVSAPMSCEALPGRDYVCPSTMMPWCIRPSTATCANGSHPPRRVPPPSFPTNRLHTADLERPRRQGGDAGQKPASVPGRPQSPDKTPQTDVREWGDAQRRRDRNPGGSSRNHRGGAPTFRVQDEDGRGGETWH